MLAGSSISIDSYRFFLNRYSCSARNTHGVVESSANIHLVLSIPPVIVEALQSTTVEPGDRVTFNCRAMGEPTPTISWYFDGSPIPTVRGHYQVV